MSDFNFEGKVALVTGGSRGMGLEIARSMLARKAKVAICARKQEGLDRAGAELGDADNLLLVPAHIAQEEEVENLFSKVKENFGRLDILINNVGMNIMTSSVTDIDYSLWNKIIDSNLNGTYLCSVHASRIMKEQKAGKIISISSIAASRASAGMGVYGVAKAAIEMLTRVMAAELADDGILVNAVAPCMVKTDFSRPFWSDQALLEEIERTIPLSRIAEPEDIVKVVLFLASAAADFITGQTIVVDGGAMAI
ncbi:MAG: glucose 1-dehydrogenase [Firmicutes bacterium]|nr:glucose 1-dehydrogenase [Bacillota bacterium]